MEANKLDNDFDSGFNNMMASAMEAEWYKQHEKPIPQELKKRLDEARDWLNGLSDRDYSRLIH